MLLALPLKEDIESTDNFLVNLGNLVCLLCLSFDAATTVTQRRVSVVDG